VDDWQTDFTTLIAKAVALGIGPSTTTALYLAPGISGLAVAIEFGLLPRDRIVEFLAVLAGATYAIGYDDGQHGVPIRHRSEEKQDKVSMETN